MSHLFTSESVTEGHPDKVCDQISDAVLDAALEQDPTARVAVETVASGQSVYVVGEMTTTAALDIERIARDTIARIGYTAESGFDPEAVEVVVRVIPQSPEIADGVDSSLELREGEAEDPYALQGAGDQGIMFGYAASDTPELMPMAIQLSHKMAQRLAEVRHDGTIPYLRPDGKTQVTVRYEGDRPVRVESVLISTQHDEGVDQDRLYHDLLQNVALPVMQSSDPTRSFNFDLLVNPSGSFVMGGPAADAGLTGRKIIVDTYGGSAPHGGGAFSGKDPSKVDRSAAYAARWVAKNIVATGLASRAQIQLAYAIGKANPVSIKVDTFGTSKYSDAQWSRAVEAVFDLRPAAIIDHLGLLKPIYADTAVYGHFGRGGLALPWEQTDRVPALSKALSGVQEEASV